MYSPLISRFHSTDIQGTTSIWIPADQQPEPGQKHISIGGSTVPIRNVDVGPVRFEMWAEESRAKGKLPEKSK